MKKYENDNIVFKIKQVNQLKDTSDYLLDIFSGEVRRV